MKTATVEHLTRDGVKLAYAETGKGSPPLILIHGLGCDHTDFGPQLEAFSRTHRVVAVDLRGHGASDKPVQDYTIAGFADDIAWLCQGLGIYRPVVIGHSMGGGVSFELARRIQGGVAAIVALDAPLFVAPQVAEAMRLSELMQAIWTPAYQDVLRGFMGATFLPTDDQARKQEILDRMCALPQHVTASAFGQLAYDLAPAVSAYSGPVLYIGAAVPTDIDRLRALCPQIAVEHVEGVGHWLMLDAAERVNAAISQFLDYVSGEIAVQSNSALHS
jgi:pimeloyl-ACP methyl ester carboxylesterase